MRADNLVRLDPQSFPYGPTLQTTELAGRIEEGYRQTVQENETLLRFVAQEFGKKGVAELERLTTAFYVTREMERGASLDDRAIRLNRLKPHVSLDEAQNAVRAADELIEKASALAA
jgi:hypothetical protein